MKRIIVTTLVALTYFAIFASLPEVENGKPMVAMFGHQDDTFYGIGWDARNGGKTSSDIKRVCGDYPAVMGFELGGLELGNTHNLDGVPFHLMLQEIKHQLNRGGVVTISWHPYNPVTEGNAWDVSCKSVVETVLPGGENHEKFVVWMTRVSEFLAAIPNVVVDNGNECGLLKSAVIFRPWHENNGSWFWWGKDFCTAQEYKALWNMLQDFIITEKGLKNLVWSYSPNYDASLTESDFLTRYPGDDRVMLLGVDAYQNGTREEFQRVLNDNLTMLCNYAKLHNKMVALTECGMRSVPDSTWWTGALLPIIQKHKLQYVLCWRNGDLVERFAPYKGSNDSRDFKKFAKSVLMLKDIKK